MDLARPSIDLGLATNRADAQLAFWRDAVGLPLQSTLRVSDAQVQHRFDANGSVIKVNCFRDPLPADGASGYRELLIARQGALRPTTLLDPDGNSVTLCPPGFDGVNQIGVRLSVRDVGVHDRFYRDALGLGGEDAGRIRAGRSLLLFDAGRAHSDRTGGSGLGWRYVTFQVRDAEAAHARAEAAGAEVARPLGWLGDVALFSILRDPDGNAFELSQRRELQA